MRHCSYFVTQRLCTCLINGKLFRVIFAALFAGCHPSPVPYPDISVPDGFVVEKVADESLLDFPMFATLDETGRLFVFESTGNVYEESEDAIADPQFRIKLLEDTDSDGIFDKATVFADKVGFPQGGVFYKGSLYASSAPDLLKLTDTDGDGKADQREVLLSGWTLNVNANSLVGPFMGPDGWLYMTNAIMGFDVTSLEGERLKGETARLWRVRPDGSGLAWVGAGGMNNPVEVSFTPSGEPIGTMTYFTNPKAGQRDALIYWTEGGVYPKPNQSVSRDGLPRTGDYLPVISKYSRVSPSGIGRYRHTSFGSDYTNNFFSAQFNTHQVVRHKLIREGASFRTEDEVFFKMEGEDFHPTDVLEDGDGSLLIVETGGWFIKGCPLSQVSKPELKGGIYRVRKIDAPRISDPYGNSISWHAEEIASLVDYLNDGRPFVRDRAEHELVQRGTLSVNSLISLLNNVHTGETARTHAVFCLYKIGGLDAINGIGNALSDPSVQVQIAAAHALGLAGNMSVSDRLAQVLIQDPSLAVRRQAASALASLKDPNSISSLLQAADITGDRMLEHAIIHALIQINSPESLVAALSDPRPPVSKTALIALDQMPSYTIQTAQMLPFFASDKETALWIASLHPEWAPDLSKFIGQELLSDKLSEEDMNALGQLLISFIHAPETQQVVNDLLSRGDQNLSDFLLTTVNRAPLDQIPLTWIPQMARILMSEVNPLQAKVLKLAQAKKISELDTLLVRYAQDPIRDDRNRMAAMLAVNSSSETIPDWQFDFLMERLTDGYEAPIRQQAAHVLENAHVSDEQLVLLSENYLPEADDFILPRLLPVFEGKRPDAVGIVLAEKLSESQTLDSYRAATLENLFAGYGTAVDAPFRRMMKRFREVNAQRLEKIEQLEKLIPTGNLDNGRVLYFGKAACATCHTIGPEGGSMGPDLTSIQRDRSAHDILEAIVYPSATFVREYETYQIKTDSGTYTGIVQEQSPEHLTLVVSPQQFVRIDQSEIMSKEILDVSMMPQGLDQVLTPREMADLMAFLLGQDQHPETDQQFLR